MHHVFLRGDYIRHLTSLMKWNIYNSYSHTVENKMFIKKVSNENLLVYTFINYAFV